jgi:replication initiator protein A
MATKDKSGVERQRLGRDELNLCEFPLGLLSDRPPKKTPVSLRFEAGDKVWEISGHQRYGLPTAGDVEVYVCLMELTREQNYPVRVEFTRHDLLRRLGWGPGAAKYYRLKLAFNRLVGVTIETANAYYDAKDRQWLRHHAFHVLDEYEFTDSRHAVSEDEPVSWFRWGEAMWKNLQAGYIKTLNVSLFLSLESAISQALYRYLDAKIRDGKTIFRQNLRDLACQHLGMSRDYWVSDIKRKLDPAHVELLAAGFMLRAEYGQTQDGKEMVVYHFPRRRAAAGLAPAAPEPAAPAADPLAERLLEHGVSPQTAAELAAETPEECERQLDYLAHRDAQDPAAVLVKAIREGWAPPQGWKEAQAKQRRQRHAQQRREQERVGEAQGDAAAAAFDARWAALPEAEREALAAQARAELFAAGPLVARHYERNPESLPEALRPILMRLAVASGADTIRGSTQ